MTSAPPPFPPFLDEIDGVLCLPATATAAEIAARIGSRALRFPLILDPTATLEEHAAAATHAPASSRFGPYCDNLLGMNWRLPDGRVLRVGERVVKTTTGYDWMRFLLHTGRRFGQPLDYLLRLRPDCGATGCFLLRGPGETVRAAAPRLLRDSWMHWFDAIDVVEEGGAPTLRVTVHCPPEEWDVFENRLGAFAVTNGFQLEVMREASMPADGLPDLVFKTSPDRVLRLAAEIARGDGLRCVALCYNGVVHAYLPGSGDPAARVRDLARPHLDALHSIGGDCRSRHFEAAASGPAEAAWLDRLQSAFSPS